MLTTTIISSMLWAGTPTSGPPTEPPPIHSVEVLADENGVQFLGYDADGVTIASLGFWLESDTQQQTQAVLVSDGAQGYRVDVVDLGTGEIIATEGDVSANVIEERNVALIRALDGGPQEGLIPCAWAAAGAVGGCVMVNPVVCLGGTIVAACQCLPQLIEEFEELSCPGF